MEFYGYLGSITDTAIVEETQTVDIFGIIGVLIGFAGAIGGFLMEGGHVSQLLLLAPFVIVFGGTSGIILFSFRIQDVTGAFKALGKTFSGKEKDMPTVVIEKVVNIANTCRAEGLLKMQTLLDDPELSTPDFLTLKAGMVMALDMKDADAIEASLETDVYAFSAQRQLHMQVFSSAGGYFPTLGILGTVMGLVHVLGNMSDPESLVASIGGAFIATLYGVGFANLFALPAAARIKSMLKREQMCKEMMTQGICMIVKGESSRSIENKLSIFYQAFPNGFKKYQEGISK